MIGSLLPLQVPQPPSNPAVRRNLIYLFNSVKDAPPSTLLSDMPVRPWTDSPTYPLYLPHPSLPPSPDQSPENPLQCSLRVVVEGLSGPMPPREAAQAFRYVLSSNSEGQEGLFSFSLQTVLAYALGGSSMFFFPLMPFNLQLSNGNSKSCQELDARKTFLFCNRYLQEVFARVCPRMLRK